MLGICLKNFNLSFIVNTRKKINILIFFELFFIGSYFNVANAADLVFYNKVFSQISPALNPQNTQQSYTDEMRQAIQCEESECEKTAKARVTKRLYELYAKYPKYFAAVLKNLLMENNEGGKYHSNFLTVKQSVIRLDPVERMAFVQKAIGRLNSGLEEFGRYLNTGTGETNLARVNIVSEEYFNGADLAYVLEEFKKVSESDLIANVMLMLMQEQMVKIWEPFVEGEPIFQNGKIAPKTNLEKKEEYFNNASEFVHNTGLIAADIVKFAWKNGPAVFFMGSMVTGFIYVLQLAARGQAIDSSSVDYQIEFIRPVPKENISEQLQNIISDSQLDANVLRKAPYSQYIKDNAALLLHTVIDENLPERLELLLSLEGLDGKKLVDPNSPFPGFGTYYGSHPVLNASESGFLEVLKVLLMHDSKLIVEDKKGFNALMLAGRDDRVEVVQYLLSRPEVSLLLKFEKDEGSEVLNLAQGKSRSLILQKINAIRKNSSS